mmetsp:Transcript_58566/g.122403  ORF Transcript_58566/g.122403 Transcript_58566/m.122403 type:complete len:85 (+) Transcript_58566:829-1083(+)
MGSNDVLSGFDCEDRGESGDFARMHMHNAFSKVVPIGFIKLAAIYGVNAGSSLNGNVRTERLLLSSMKIFQCFCVSKKVGALKA